MQSTYRNHVWVVQKKEGGRWASLRDTQGVITIKTRKLARNIAREYKNTSRNPRKFRVAKFSMKV
jgi:hypothetical protein